MESMVITPRSEAAAASLKSFLARAKGGFHARAVSGRTETLEAKIARLYAEGHYEDREVERFFSIPKEHRVDPFNTIDDGDVYYADKRNVDYVKDNIEQARRDRAAGRCVEKRPGESFDDFLERITADGSV